MKKFTKLLMLMALIILPACSNNGETDSENASDETQTEETSDKVQDEQPDEESSQSESDTNSDNEVTSTDSVEETQDDNSPAEEEGLLTYRPEEGKERVFKENNQQVFKEEIIAADAEYVQMLVTLGGSLTTEIYRWTSEELTLVYQEYSDPEDPEGSILEGFEPSTEAEKIIGEKADWELISEEETLTIGDITYENVKKVKRVTDEVVGSDTIIVRYYAPNYGLVKEEMEVTGDNGYKSTVVLE
ncbi:hypothetical protein ACQCVP_15100 [Rossellomorea vietnamensis]|uniref:hypothetical protein n=1 Tax=Rossellomorea vietnamensis TaxID=218284 RepID=UPI003CEEB038